MNNPRVNFRTFLVIIACAAMAGSCGISFGQADEIKESNTQQLQILLRTEGLDIVSPEIKATVPDLKKDQMLAPPDWKAKQERNQKIMLLRKRQAQSNQKSDAKKIGEQLSQQIEILAHQGNDVQGLKELFGKLQHLLETAEIPTADDIAVAAFAVPEEPQQRPEGNPKPTPPMIHAPMAGHPGFMPPMAQHGMAQHPMAQHGMQGGPGFMPPMLMMQHRMQLHQGMGPQIHQPEAHQPEGPFADDHKRIAALKESAERLAHAGLPDAAHGLMERAGHIQRELAEKQERTQREENERAQAKMREQQGERGERADHPALPIHELHEQLEQLRREMHSINEKVTHLTEMIKHHHREASGRDDHEEMDDDDDRADHQHRDRRGDRDEDEMHDRNDDDEDDEIE